MSGTLPSDILYELIFYLKYPDIINLFSTNKYLYSYKNHARFSQSIKIKYYKYTYGSLFPLLINSCILGDYDLVTYLLTQDIDPSLPYSVSSHINGHCESFKLRPDTSNRIINTDNRPNFAIRVAKEHNHTDIVNLLLKDLRVSEKLSSLELFFLQ